VISAWIVLFVLVHRRICRKIDYWFWALDWKGDLIYIFLNSKGKIGKRSATGAILAGQTEAIDNIAKISIPIMFIHGSRDWVIRPWHSEVLYQKAGGMKKKIFIKNGSHAENLMRIILGNSSQK